MSDRNIMQALFNQQRLQIMHIGKHHNEFTDAYLFAWESGVYPAMSDTDGSVPQKPHEPFADFFITPKEKTLFLAKRLDDAWLNKEGLTFYALEDELQVRYKPGWDRGDLLNICRYLYLDNCFDHDFWKTLVKNGECPSEAHSIMSVFKRTEDIYFM
ncbi:MULTISPECIES: hypothetical protein [Enterobacteriaceae]|uniref:hypothetical protein n=1 Tax=Enterobacteriaceae TaxID=543 RepID=UPI0009AABB27|nr:MULTISPECIES: hypothetical protein [Enterobacteriaceae]MDM3122737.1 hypothetical protein [Citrobacter sp. Cf125]